MSSGSQFLDEAGAVASDFSLLSLRRVDTRPRAQKAFSFDVTLPASIAHRTAGISLGAVPLSWGHCPRSRPSLCPLSLTPSRRPSGRGRLMGARLWLRGSGVSRHLLVSAPFSYVQVSMHENGRDLWSPMPMLHFGENPTPRGLPTDLMQPPLVSASPRAWSVAKDGRVDVNQSTPGRRCGFRSGTRRIGEAERFGAVIFWS